MSNRADLWLGNNAPNAQRGNTELRYMETARLISARPSVIVVTRKVPGVKGDIELAPQTVRVEIVMSIRGATEQSNAMMEVSRQYVIVIGLRDHPSLPNLDIRRGDRFFMFNRQYEVIELVDVIPGRLLASCEVGP